MKHNFLNTVANYLIQRHGDKLSDIVLVVPNIRAGLYLRKSFTHEIKHATWAPEIISIQDFFHKQSGLISEEQIPLVFELYKSFQRVAPDLFPTFDQFYPWGEVILSDFNDLDSNLAEPKQVFANVADLKNIELFFSEMEENVLKIIREFWSQLEEGDENYARKRFLEVWKQMLPVYQDFKKQLADQGIGYEGMIYRQVAEELDNQLFPQTQKEHYFIGFNVLSQSEQFVFRYFRNQHQAEFFWQYDEELMKHPYHEAFRFIRQYIREFPIPEDFQYESKIREKHIKIYAVPSKTAQVKLAANLITNDLKQNDPNFERSALILPDESLLQPVLYSIPEDVKHLNVSMGFPVKYAPQAGIVRLLSKLQENASKEKFYHKDVIRLLNHPLLRSIDSDGCQNMKQLIIRENWLRIPQETLQKSSEIFASIFTHIQDVNEIGNYFSQNLKMIYEQLQAFSDMEFDREIVYQLYRRVNRFNEYLIRDRIYFTNLKTYLHLQNSMLNSVSVAFSGEPLKGLQVLGMLETRLLDFDQMIILSLNEGHFPSQSFKKSFIPYNLRRAFNLPTIELQDAIHAYYFYRMIMHPEKLHLLYNTADEGYMKGEKSRYIQQLLVESPLKISQIPVHIAVETHETEVRELTKDSHTLAVLEKYKNGGGKSFSPSQLNTYIHCSMAFYYKYILGVREEDELVDQIGAMESGNVVHNTMKMLYDPFLNKQIRESDFDALLKNDELINETILVAWKEQMRKAGDMEISGLNALGMESVREYVKRILLLDKAHAPIKHLGGELEIGHEFQVKTDSETFSVLLKGSIDHLDYANGQIRVVDYKTGGEKKNKLSAISDAFVVERKSELDYTFQVMFYAWLVINAPEFLQYQEAPVKPMVLFTRLNQLSNVSLDKVDLENFRPLVDEWHDAMNSLLVKIFDADNPFKMTSEDSHCKYCPFYKLCY